MIGLITGKIIWKKPTELLIDVNGIGFIIHISVNTFDKLGNENDVVKVYTYLSVKEDALDLYGFINLHEKEMFQLLISVNGIGPKSALSILSGIGVEDLKDAIRTAQLNRLVAIPGIGRKTAERLLVELRDKISNLTSSGYQDSYVRSDNRSDAVAALVSLGYNQKIAEKTITGILDNKPTATIEEIVRQALSSLNK